MVTSTVGAETWRVGIDIGGTFTDIAVVSSNGHVSLWKEDSTKGRPEEAVQKGLHAVAERFDLTLREFLQRTTLLVHGSTIATNLVIERDGPTVGLLCTNGFRDVLYLRDGFKWERFNDRLPRPRDFVDRRRRVGVRERIGPKGEIRVPLDEDSVRAAARTLMDRGAESIAVALLWSNANPVHERRIREVLKDDLGDKIPIVLSSDILPEIGEWVRASAAVLSAYIYPRSARYLTELKRWLGGNGLERDVLIMHVNGGCATVERTLQMPIGIITSGPAAAPAAARHAARRLGARDMITIDMGGTSFDVCLVRNGDTPLTREMQIEHQPIGVQAVDLHTIGAGGGSIAWIDNGAALRVGPESAGARPGPAAYDLGGQRPTVTDANVILGYLAPSAFLGGRRKLRKDLSVRAIEEHVARPLGLDVVKAAAAIIDIVNANMVDAIRVVSVKKGVDPQAYLLIAGGGAGPLHAASLAAKIGIARVLVPAEAGAICAFGMTVTDVVHDYAAMVHTTSRQTSVAIVADAIDALEKRARADLASSGFADDEIVLNRFVDARYEGQVHELTIPVPGGPLMEETLEQVAAAFHESHRERYTWAMADHPVEYIHWRVSGIGLIERPPTAAFDAKRKDAEAARTGKRLAYFSACGGMTETSVYDTALFTSGATLDGPAVIESPTTTIVVPPGQVATADGHGSFLIETNVGTATKGLAEIEAVVHA